MAVDIFSVIGLAVLLWIIITVMAIIGVAGGALLAYGATRVAAQIQRFDGVRHRPDLQRALAELDLGPIPFERVVPVRDGSRRS